VRVFTIWTPSSRAPSSCGRCRGRGASHWGLPAVRAGMRARPVAACEAAPCAPCPSGPNPALNPPPGGGSRRRCHASQRTGTLQGGARPGVGAHRPGRVERIRPPATPLAGAPHTPQSNALSAPAAGCPRAHRRNASRPGLKGSPPPASPLGRTAASRRQGSWTGSGRPTPTPPGPRRSPPRPHCPRRRPRQTRAARGQGCGRAGARRSCAGGLRRARGGAPDWRRNTRASGLPAITLARHSCNALDQREQ
jgi:hypothetical protein